MIKGRQTVWKGNLSIKIFAFLSLSLLFFNVGIEIAQLAIIPIPFLIIFFFKDNKFFQNIKYLIAIIIGGIGVYWFIERVVGIFL